MVYSLDSSSNFICQNPEFASILLKYLLPSREARVSSKRGRGKLSLLTLLLSCVRSTHSLTLPFDFGATTIPEHHSVGFSTFSITPILSILSNSFLVASLNPMGTLLGTFKHNGMAPSFKFIRNTSGSSPSSLNSFGCFDCTSSFTSLTVRTKLNFLTSGLPRRLFLPPFITYTVFVTA